MYVLCIYLPIYLFIYLILTNSAFRVSQETWVYVLATSFKIQLVAYKNENKLIDMQVDV